MGDTQLMIISVGVVSMGWRLVDKYYNLFEKLHNFFHRKFNIPPTVCLICVTFWLHLIGFIIIGEPVTGSFIKALACTPFTLELSKSVWQ